MPATLNKYIYSSCLNAPCSVSVRSKEVSKLLQRCGRATMKLQISKLTTIQLSTSAKRRRWLNLSDPSCWQSRDRSRYQQSVWSGKCRSGWFVSSEWVSSVLHPHQHSIGYTGDGFYRLKDPTNSIKVLKEMLQKRKKKMKTTKYTYTYTITYTQNDIHKISTASPLVCNNMWWLRGRLPQRAGSLGLNGGEVPPRYPLVC